MKKTMTEPEIKQLLDDAYDQLAATDVDCTSLEEWLNRRATGEDNVAAVFALAREELDPPIGSVWARALFVAVRYHQDQAIKLRSRFGAGA